MDQYVIDFEFAMLFFDLMDLIHLIESSDNEELKKYLPDLYDLLELHKSNGSAGEEVLSLKRTITRKDLWISVDDYLPIKELRFKGDSLPVQVYRPNHITEVIGCYFTDNGGNYDFVTDEGIYLNGVTHWAKLKPPPPAN